MHPVSGDFALPRFFLEYHPTASQSVSQESIVFENFNQSFKKSEDDASASYILGHPIVQNKIQHAPVFEALKSNRTSSDFYKELNGEFLLIHINKTKQTLTIINDRFTSIPFYYLHQDNQFIGSVFYNDIWKWLQNSGTLKLNPSAFFEFLWLQRLLGNKTYDQQTQFLPAATILTFDGHTSQRDTYWHPSFHKTQNTLKDCTAHLGFALQQSLKRKTSDKKTKIGLFLSGGRDSRTVLAALDAQPTCFTLSVSHNNEYQVAREVAEAKACPHVFLPLEADPYSAHLDKLIQMGGGMYVFDHALFSGFKEAIASQCEVAFHGHGIDYMFQGMYVPQEQVYWGNRKTSFRKLRVLSQDLTTDFLTNISYRLKGVDLLNYVVPQQRDALYESLRASVKNTLSKGEDFCNTPYDFWEYLLMHALSRHYPHTNLTSMSTCVEQRTPTFDNDIFDLYLSLPPHYRVNAKIAIALLKHLNPQLAKIRTGNTNMRADLTPAQIECIRYWDVFLRKTRLRKRTIFWTPAEERTWPDRDRILRAQPQLKKHALDLAHSEALANLGFLDMDALSHQIPRWLEQPSGGGAFMFFLITLDRFLKQ